MKKILLSLLMVLLLVGCTNKDSDAYKFKTEYEKLNNQDNGYGSSYRELKISKKNPFVYITDEELVKKFDNEESFIVYFGFSSCPWCRSVVNNIVEVSKELEIDTVYYLDVKGIRSIIDIDENGELKTTTQGSEGYYKLLNKMSNVLEDYELVQGENVINAGEKRIYAPNIVTVKKGKAISLTTAISSKLSNPYDELTEEINKESKDMIREQFNEYLTNDSCSLDKAC